MVVAIGHNPRKQRTLDLPTRLSVLEEVCAPITNVRVSHFEGLLVHYCERIGAKAILRGLRAVTDFEFEFQTGLANMDMSPSVETVFLLTEPRHIFVSSSLIKEIALNGGPAARYLPEASWRALASVMSLEETPMVTGARGSKTSAAD